MPQQIENGRFFLCLKSALNPHTSEKDVSQIFSSPYDQLLSMLNWGVPPSIHTNTHKRDLLHNTSFNTFPCVHIMQRWPTNSPWDWYTHTCGHGTIPYAAAMRWARKWLLNPPPPAPNVKWTKESPQHPISGRGVRGSETPELDARLNEVDSVCD